MDLPEKHLEVVYIPEPDLCFGYGQVCDHPKDGLFLYGPHSGPTRSKEISIGVIGTHNGLKYFRNWAIKLGGFIPIPPPGKTDKEHRLHLSNFPGMEEAFGLVISPGDFVELKISPDELDRATRTANHHEAVRKAVDLYIHEIERYDRNEERTVDIWVFILPELIFERCKSLAKRTGLELVKGDFLEEAEGTLRHAVVCWGDRPER